MKNADSVIIYRIVHNFKGIPCAVKPNNRVFLRKSLNHSVTYFTLKRVQDILFGNIMPERGLVELNYDVHWANVA